MFWSAFSQRFLWLGLAVFPAPSLAMYFSCRTILRTLHHGWSLAVEGHFYLLLPLFFAALLWIGRKSPDPFRAIPLTSVTLTVACLVMRISTSTNNQALWDQIEIAYPTHLRVDALFLGVTLGYYFHFQSLHVTRPWVLGIFGLFLLLPALAFGTASIFTATVGLTLTSFGYACILIWALSCRWKHRCGLAWMGRYSYSIYLWHALIATFSKNTLGETPFSFWIYVIRSLAIGGRWRKLSSCRC
jgi:peptidoglycan/LPS O-acetylase OafA/YrhL